MRLLRGFVAIICAGILLGGVGCGDDDTGCDNPCFEQGETRCEGDWVQTCDVDTGGCLSWTNTTDCTQTGGSCEEQTDAAQCSGGCSDACAAADDTQCSGTVIQTCVLGGDGCLAWEDGTDCADNQEICTDSSGDALCADGCTDLCAAADDTQCAGTVIQTCVLGGDGCLAWEDVTDCADSQQICDDSAGNAACATDCTAVHPDAPTSPAPTDGIQDVDPLQDVDLDWADAAGATSYELFFGACPAPTYPDAAYVAVASSDSAGHAVVADTEYCWRVVALDDAGCTAVGPEWHLTTACIDEVLAPPAVTSGPGNYPSGTTSGAYSLVFTEGVLGVGANVSWTAGTGTGTLGAVTAIDSATYSVAFSGVADGDTYILTVGVGVTDLCGTPLTMAVDIPIYISGSGQTCASPIDVTNEAFPYFTTGNFVDDPAQGGSCFATPANAVWFSYTPTATAYYDITAQNLDTSTMGTTLAIFEGAGCNPLGVERFCGNSANKVMQTTIELTAGQTYLLLFHTDDDTHAMVDPVLVVDQVVYLPGEVCAAAVDLTTQTMPYNLTGNYSDDPATGGSCDTTPNNAVWYRYTPSSTDLHEIVAYNNYGSGSTRVAVFEYTDCSTMTEIACGTGTSSTTTTATLTAGTEYMILFYTGSDSYPMQDPAISVQPFTADPGELCPASVDLTGQTFPYQLTGSFDYEPLLGPSCDTSPTNVVWYTYTPATTDTYVIDVVNNTTTSAYSRLAVFEGTGCDPHGAELACKTMSTDYVQSDPLSLVAGTTYLIMFFTDGQTYTMVDPTITVSVLNPDPGQICSEAIDVTGQTFPYQVIGDFPYEPATGGSCDTSGYNAIWYTYTPTVTDTYALSVTAALSNVDVRVAVFESSACQPRGAQVACEASTTSTATTPPVMLTAGTTYLILAYGNSGTYAMTDPTLDIQPVAINPGELCEAAEDLTTATLPHQLTGTFSYEPASGGSCDTSPTNAAWFTYTPTTTDTYQVTATNATSSSYSRLAVFESGACSPLGPEVTCGTATAPSITSSPLLLTAGTTYTILFHTDSDIDTMVNPTVDIQPYAVAPGEVCGSAADVSSETFPYMLSGTFSFEPGLGGSCDTTATNVVWFRYTPTSAGWYQIALDNNATISASSRLAVFEGAGCAPYGTELQCASVAGTSAGALVYLNAGTDYLIMFYTSSNTYTMVDPTIDIAPSAPPPPGGSCMDPSTVTASNHFLGTSNEDCWNWSSDPADMSGDHDFGCDSATGGDAVIEYTTGPAQTTLNYDALTSQYGASDYIAFEITDGACTTPTQSLICTSTGDTAVGSVAVTPSTTYYIWIGNGFSGNHRPQIDVCLW